MINFNIAIGKSHSDQRFKNKEISWADFCEIISKTHRTAETYQEYVDFKKDKQDAIKDIGGFVGGYLSMGRRLKSSVTTRQLLTFDADAAEVNFWDRFCLQYGCAAAIYSTHKHLPDQPRCRLLIPLDREVFPDEYVAIVRRIAGDVGIDQFDHTGFQPERIMYWPSTSKDAEFVYKEQVGPALCADDILNRYRNWADISEWPMGSREVKILDSNGKKQGDPLKKPGLIGAFNRAYPIDNCIKTFLADIYETTEVENRYTYTKGSTAAGVIVYDNEFIFSHHSTDPISGMLCNAFDLVRLHKFKNIDNGDDTPINKRPSYLAMCDFVADDESVKKQIGEAKLEKALGAFSDIAEYAEEVELGWLQDMDVDRKGNYLLTINNVALILEKDPIFKDNLAYDDFEQQAIFRRNLPWRKTLGRKKTMTDNDYANIENYIEKVYKLACGLKLHKGLAVVLEKHRFHPIVDYLKSIYWDGVERINGLLECYLGASSNLYTETVTRKALVACVARVCKPGIKFDNCLTLVGAEGQGKSALWDSLGGEWFSDTFNMHMLKNKEAYEQIQGVWLIEIGELAGMATAEIERVKGFLAARQDRYRSPYLRTTELKLRQCVFFASTNTTNFLKSQNGNRRFWPVATFETTPRASAHNITKEERDQIWAEAYKIYLSGEDLYLSKEVEALALEVQTDYTEENPWTGLFINYLNYKIPDGWYKMTKWEKIEYVNTYGEETEGTEKRTTICKYELWEVALGKKDVIDAYGVRQIDVAMSKIKGWEKTKEYARFGQSYPRHKGSWCTSTKNVGCLL